MRRQILSLLFMIMVMLTGTSATGFAKELSSQPLQSLIDRTPSGGLLNLPPGTYEGALKVTKPITIKGAGVTILHHGSGPALTVKANQVHLEGMHLMADSPDPKTAVVLIEGERNVIRQLTIDTAGNGIFLRQSHNNRIEQVVIRGNEGKSEGKLKLSDRGNGIDLLESHHNLITHCQISSMHDGVYMESSDDNRVMNNQVTNSRYGFHCMYTARPVIENNEGQQNVTGAMVMGADDALIRNNQFRKQSENVNSQGLLLFEVKHSQIEKNLLDGNRVGIYVETSTNNKLWNNQVYRNFIGLEMKRAEQNEIRQNEWIANVTQVEVMDSPQNKVTQNYWDDFQGISLSGTNISDLPYHSSPFFLKLATLNPAYQVFFQSPGMVFLEGLMHTEPSSGMTDPAPLMHPPSSGEGDSPGNGSVLSSFLVSLLLIAASSVLYLIFGGKTK